MYWKKKIDFLIDFQYNNKQNGYTQQVSFQNEISRRN